MFALFTVFSVISAIAVTILLAILVLPESKRARLNGFGKFLHDLFNFKSLLIEKILKFLYIFATAFTIIYGFLSLFSFVSTYDYVYVNGNYVEVESLTWTGYTGFLYMILGPIAIRIAYEFIMMFILAVNNIISINNKLAEKKDAEIPAADNTPEA